MLIAIRSYASQLNKNDEKMNSAGCVGLMQDIVEIRK
ncbi:Uncharacterised protein [Salmonella enterica subsp. arizonae]|nr:Uncharacterised protein [Salmonella enterica subsp. arizonae]